jgi:hypothetical protein
MDKMKPRLPSSAKPIAEKIVAKVKQSTRRKVINIGNVVRGRAMAEDLQKTIASRQDLAPLDPAHAAYVFAQNQVSVLSQQLTALKWMAPFAEFVSEAENLYMPSAPPMSPLTTSFFTCWAFFDACAIFLAGLPDDPESRPHSPVSEANGWKAPNIIRTR